MRTLSDTTIAETYLRLSRDRSDVADFAAFDGIDDAALANVRVSNEADGDLLLVRVQLGELPEKLDKRSFAERMVG